MNNNDILIRTRYALDIRDIDLVTIFQLGGESLSKETIKLLLTKTQGSYDYDPGQEVQGMVCTNHMLEVFLNGLILFKRGIHRSKDGEEIKPSFQIKPGTSPNNVVLKKLKIALALTSEDILDIFKLAEVEMTPTELSALFRNESHKHYRVCMDKYARSFLKGLGLKYREKDK